MNATSRRGWSLEPLVPRYGRTGEDPASQDHTISTVQFSLLSRQSRRHLGTIDPKKRGQKNTKKQDVTNGGSRLTWLPFVVPARRRGAFVPGKTVLVLTITHNIVHGQPRAKRHYLPVLFLIKNRTKTLNRTKHELKNIHLV